MDEAVSDIRKRIMSVESDITRWQQRQNQSNNFTANIPYDLEQMRSETKEFMTDLMSRDQRMMLALVTLTHLADNLEQLDQDTEALQAIGRARGCQFNILRYQQEDALNTVLPLGLKRIDATRTLTTECTAVLMPFKSQEIQDAGGIYYGVNAVSHHFNRNQIAALDELLEQRDLLRELIEDVYSVSGDTAALIRSLPEGLSPEREAVVRTACSLVGKVNYFWGGKSLVIGWDVRWGELRQVTAAGSSTTGTYRPYGLDCSGFVDWVFYNQSGGSYVIGHGGGATMQHSYCTNISWADAQPGDLVFYPDNSHVGIVGGRDANGELLIIHCASGYNNVVVTGLEGFASIARPNYYTN